MKNNDKKNNFLDVFNKFPFSMQPDLSMFEPATDDEKKQQDMMRPSSSFFKDGIKRFNKNKVSIISLIVIAIITLIAFIVPIFYPYQYQTTTGGESYSEGFLAPFEYSIRENIIKYNSEDVVFAGWSKCNTDSLQKHSYGGLPVITSEDELNKYKDLIVTSTVKFSGESIELFAVWVADLDHNGVPDFGANLFSNGTATTTYSHKYNLNYDINGGTGNAPVDNNDYCVSDRIALVHENLEFSKNGYVFIGWSISVISPLDDESSYLVNKNSLLNNIKLTADTTIYAVWAIDANNDGLSDFNVSEITYSSAKLNRFSLVYNTNLANEDAPIDSKIYYPGDKVAPINVSSIELTKMHSDIFPHILGTDLFGRDFAIRVIVGTRVSLLVGIVAALMVVIIGVLYGSISGFLGGRVDMIMMRFVDIIYSLPDTLIIILLSVSLGDVIKSGPLAETASKLGGAGMVSILVVFALLYWVGMARLVRGQVLSLREQEYVLAAKAMGAKPMSIIFKHMLPNCMSVIFISAALQIPSAIFTESTLSFLGIGVNAPMPSLGSLASEGRLYMSIESQRYLFIFPALTIFLIVLSLNLLGQGLRDAFDPKLRSKGGN